MTARAGLPAAVRGSEALYRRLLGLYPSGHRREFGFWMEQVFRDLCRQAYRREGGRGLAKVWLRTFPDLAQSAILEHEDEIRRWLMDADRNSQMGTHPRWALSLIISAVILAAGIFTSIALRESGAPVILALAAVVVFNLAGALVFDLFTMRDGAVLGAMGLMMLLSALPLLWVPDQAAWIRENPLTYGVMILISASIRYKYRLVWPMYAVGLILGAAHILASFI